MLYASDSDRFAFFITSLVVMPPFILLSYWALRKSKTLPGLTKWRVRFGASALLMLGIIFICVALITLLAPLLISDLR